MKSTTFPSTLPNFFVLEGLDGSGKTTLISELKKKLADARFDREPTYSELGKQIRESIKANKEPLQDETLLLLFTADRWEHVFGKGGMASKKADEILFCDRYFFSTLAYQGTTEPILSYAKELSKSFPLPQIVFYLDIDPEVSLSRLGKRDEDLQAFENLERLTEIRKNYEKVFLDFQKEQNLRIIKLDACLPSHQLADQILEAIREF